MKLGKVRSFMGICALLSAGAAWADIPSPTLDKVVVTGSEAADLAKILPGDYEVIPSDGPLVQKKKIFRTGSDRAQIVCFRLETRGESATQVKSERCEMQKSGNQEPLFPARDRDAEKAVVDQLSLEPEESSELAGILPGEYRIVRDASHSHRWRYSEKSMGAETGTAKVVCGKTEYVSVDGTVTLKGHNCRMIKARK